MYDIRAACPAPFDFIFILSMVSANFVLRIYLLGIRSRNVTPNIVFSVDLVDFVLMFRSLQHRENALVKNLML